MPYQASPRLLKARANCGLEPDRLVVVGDGPVVILEKRADAAAIVVGAGVERIDVDGAVEIGHRPVVAALLGQGMAAVAVGDRQRAAGLLAGVDDGGAAGEPVGDRGGPAHAQLPRIGDRRLRRGGRAEPGQRGDRFGGGWVDVGRLLVILDRVLAPPELLVGIGASSVALRVLRIEANFLAEVLGGAFKIALIEMRQPAVAEEHGAARIQPDRLVEIGHGAVEVAELQGGAAAPVEEDGRGGGEGDRPVVVGDRAGQVAAVAAGIGAVEPALGGARIDLDCLVEVADRLREILVPDMADAAVRIGRGEAAAAVALGVDDGRAGGDPRLRAGRLRFADRPGLAGFGGPGGVGCPQQSGHQEAACHGRASDAET